MPRQGGFGGAWDPPDPLPDSCTLSGSIVCTSAW